MQKKKIITATIIILFVIATSYLFFTERSQVYLRKIPVFNTIYGKSTLTINTPRGIGLVTINGTEYGETPLETLQLTEGRQDIELTKISDGEGFYDPIKLSLNLLESTEGFINLEIGPNGQAYGYIIYYDRAPARSGDKGFISVHADAMDSTIAFDGNNSTKLPIDAKLMDAGEYRVKVTALGHESVELPIIIRKDYNLNLEIRQYPIPIKLDSN